MSLELLIRASLVCVGRAEKLQLDENAATSRMEVKAQFVRQAAERSATCGEIAVRDVTQLLSVEKLLQLCL
jgi:hypothetical protein